MVLPFDGFMSVKQGTFGELLHGLVTKLALGIAPLLKREASRCQLIFGRTIRDI
jgi:hypothetical protein